MTLPPIPPWDGIHPLVVHLPIGALLVVPALVALGIIIPRCSRAYWISALVVMLTGTAGAFAAVSSGKAGAQLVERTPEITKALMRHQALAEDTISIFALLTAVFGLIVFLPPLVGKELKRGWVIAIGVVFLAAWGVGLLSLVQTGHMGGTMVHEMGVRAMMSR